MTGLGLVKSLEQVLRGGHEIANVQPVAGLGWRWGSLCCRLGDSGQVAVGEIGGHCARFNGRLAVIIEQGVNRRRGQGGTLNAGLRLRL